MASAPPINLFIAPCELTCLCGLKYRKHASLKYGKQLRTQGNKAATEHLATKQKHFYLPFLIDL